MTHHAQSNMLAFGSATVLYMPVAVATIIAMKLSRFLYHHTPHGKHELRRLLAAGRVRVNNTVETDSQYQVGEFSRVELDDTVLYEKSPVYIMLNKPAGYLSATRDNEHPTVMELVDGAEDLHLAGRLDRATTGLLILTNDGKWSRRLTEPVQVVPKVYQVSTAFPITDDTHARFEQGIYFAYEDLTTQPAQLEILTANTARLTIHEGRYHQIKRMFHAVGNRVTSLHRESVGNIRLDAELAPGEYRALTDREVSNHRA